MRFFYLMLALGTALVFTLVSAAHAEPWSVTGQTRHGGGIDNPDTNVVGLLGEVENLPYQVPPGKTLVITQYGMEGHDGSSMQNPLFVIFVWISDSPMPFATPQDRVVRALLSCLVRVGTVTCPVEYHVPAGMWVNVRLLFPEANNFMLGWAVFGHLES